MILKQQRHQSGWSDLPLLGTRAETHITMCAVHHFPLTKHDNVPDANVALGLVSSLRGAPDESCAEIVGEGVDRWELGVVHPGLQIQELLQPGTKVLLPSGWQRLFRHPAGHLHKTFFNRKVRLWLGLLGRSAVSLKHWWGPIGRAIGRGKTC